ncbi:MAG: PIN domain-containing protein [Methyloceanibacter sp.]|uniref:PIN domain-containing protein n=1 Tax=Methyloceanibacter sp. TaxID=1965321 RepID=UPI003D6CA309
MKIECFLDTNVLLYAALGKKAEEAKRAKAADLIGRLAFGVSTQVLQEFYTAAIKQRTGAPLSPANARRWVEDLSRQPCAIVDEVLIQMAIEVSWRYRINYWDGAILAAAERLGAEIVYTEDLNHEQSYGPVRVINPFL